MIHYIIYNYVMNYLTYNFLASCENGDLNEVKRLLKNDLSFLESIFSAFDSITNTTYNEGFLKACRRNKIEVAKYLDMYSNTSAYNITNWYYEHAMHIVYVQTYYDNFELIKWLFELNKITDYTTCFLKACAHDNYKVAKFLHENAKESINIKVYDEAFKSISVNHISKPVQMTQFLYNIRKDINNKDFAQCNLDVFSNFLVRNSRDTSGVLKWLYEQCKFSEIDIYNVLTINLTREIYHTFLLDNINNLKIDFGKIKEHILDSFPYDFEKINSLDISVYYKFVSLLLDNGISWKDNLDYLNKENVRFKYVTVFKKLCEKNKSRVNILTEIIPFLKVKKSHGRFIPIIESIELNNTSTMQTDTSCTTEN